MGVAAMTIIDSEVKAAATLNPCRDLVQKIAARITTAGVNACDAAAKNFG